MSFAKTVRQAFVVTMLCLVTLVGHLPEASARGDLSRGDAVKAAVGKYPGKVVKISTQKQFFHIRVLQKNGRVITVKVNKKTGTVKKSR